MSDEASSNQISIKDVVMIWPSLTRPRGPSKAAKFAAAPSYQATLMLPMNGDELKAVKAKLAEIAKAKFGRLSELKFPLENGDKLAEARPRYDYVAGHVLLKLKVPEKRLDGSLNNPPRLVVLRNRRWVAYDDIENPRSEAQKFFYSGVHVAAVVNFSAYEGFAGGITAYIGRLGSLGYGPKLGGGIDDDEALGDAASMSEYVGRLTKEDPTKGMSDDEIPF